MKIFSMVFLLLLAAAAQSQTIKLESTISGNQEQPQVLYMVPWKVPNSPTLKFDALNRPFHGVFEHLEHDELKRQMHASAMLVETTEETEQQSD